MTKFQDNQSPYLTMVEQSSDPATPASGLQVLFIDESDGHLKRRTDAGTVIDLEDLVSAFLDLSDVPSAYTGEAGNVLAVNGTEDGLEFITPSGGSSLTNSNISPTTTNVSAAVNTRYFADVSGLTADRNFILPAGAIGDEIEINITVGDDAFELIIIGDTGISINGGSTATEWSRLFITGEAVRLVANSTSSWRVVYDGRIPCKGLMTLSGNDTTSSAATNTLPTWDNTPINIGNICDTTNKRMNIRRAGYYTPTGVYAANGSPANGTYLIGSIFLNGTGGTLVNRTLVTTGNANNLASVVLASRSQLCAVGDYLDMWYRTEGANMGAAAAECWFMVEER